MKIRTKLLGLLAACVFFSSHASFISTAGAGGLTPDVLQQLDKGLKTTLQLCAKEGPDRVWALIEKQWQKIDDKIKFDSDAKKNATATMASGVQDHQDRITPTALTGDISYKFTYTELGKSEDVKIKRREITDLLGQMASIRLTGADMSSVLTADAGKSELKDIAPALNTAVENLKKEKADVLTRIVKFIRCLANADMYKTLATQLASEGLVADTSSSKYLDSLYAANVILGYTQNTVGKDHVEKNSAVAALQTIVNSKTTMEDAINALTPSVLQAFTTLLFLQRAKGADKGEVKNLNQYLITRGNARKVMKDTGGRLLLCDDISLEASGLLALGWKADGVTALVGSTQLNIGASANAYVLPSAVLLDDKGVPIVGTPVIPAPYLEYAINNGKLPSVNNIIVGSTVSDGVRSVLTTYGTSLGLKELATLQTSAVADCADDNNKDNTGGLSAAANAGKLIPSDKIVDAEKIVTTANTNAAGTTTDAAGGTNSDLSFYGVTDPKLGAVKFKFDTKATTVIMNSLLANGISVAAAANGNADVDNIAKGPFYAARILKNNCPGSATEVGSEKLYNSTAAVMLCSGKDMSIRSMAKGSKVKAESGVTDEQVAKRIAAISKYVIPGFDANTNGDYAVTGLDISSIPDLDGTNDSKVVLTGKGAQLLAAINSISKK